MITSLLLFMGDCYDDLIDWCLQVGAVTLAQLTRLVNCCERQVRRFGVWLSGDHSREIIERFNASLGRIQTVPAAHIKIDIDQPAHRTRVYHVSKDGTETEISDTVRAIHFTARVGELATVTLECYAGAAAGEYVLTTRKALTAPRS